MTSFGVAFASVLVVGVFLIIGFVRGFLLGVEAGSLYTRDQCQQLVESFISHAEPSEEQERKTLLLRCISAAIGGLGEIEMKTRLTNKKK